jgi:isochorismate synthase
MPFDVVGEFPRWHARALTAARQAIAARRTERRAFVRIEVPFGDIDPFDLLACPDEPSFAWADGTRALTFVTGAPVSTIEPSPGKRLEDQCAALQEAIFGDLSGPLLVGGCAFSSTIRWPEWPLARFFLPNWHVVRSAHRPTTCFLTTEVQPNDVAHKVVQRLRHNLPKPPVTENSPEFRGEIDCRPVEGKASWMGRVERAAHEVAQGALAKVVLAREVAMTPPQGTQFATVQTLRRLREEHPGSITFAMHVPGRGTFLGATPETLVEVTGTEVSTHALAGTIRRGSDDEEDNRLARQLFESTKDRQEHRVVVDAIVQTLRPMCTDLNVSEVPRPIRLLQMQHLATPIVGRLTRPINVLSLARELHPTPAVGGWPRAQAAQYLDDYEPTRRGWYAAPIGWLDSNFDGVFGVAIRSALVTPQHTRAWVGAGIVSASDPEREWHETDLKLRTIVSGLALEPCVTPARSRGDS